MTKRSEATDEKVDALFKIVDENDSGVIELAEFTRLVTRLVNRYDMALQNGSIIYIYMYVCMYASLYVYICIYVFLYTYN